MSALKFLGCTVRAFQQSASYNTNGPSQLNVSLAEDAADGDLFAPGELFRPVYFTAGSCEFNGILQKYAQRDSVDGFPTYEAVVVDPRELLDGVKVILGGYSGSVSPIVNLVNVFGWWEAQGYGLSQSDETGMPWQKVKAALDSICGTSTAGNYGGPINYRGYTYSLDLSQLPIISQDYRVGQSSTVPLLELLAQVLEDHGCDFLTDLVGTTIRIRPVSRRAQPRLNTLQALTEATRGTTLVRSETGIEARNEVTSTFLFGGEVRVLHQTSSATSFWGFNVAGTPILGTPTNLHLDDRNLFCYLEAGLAANDVAVRIVFFGTNDSNYQWDKFLTDNNGAFSPFYLSVDSGREIIKVTQNIGGDLYSIERGQFETTPQAFSLETPAYLCYESVPCDFMNLNASPVSDIIGSLVYPCTTFELRLVKSEAGITGWGAYLQHYRPEIASIIGLLPPLKNKGGDRRPLAQDLVNDLPAGMAALVGVTADAWSKALRFYEFLKVYADEYMGRKYAVGLPIVLHKQNAETLRISTSYDIDDGGWLEEGSQPLGLSVLNQDVFKVQDGRFRAFAVYTNVIGADFSLASPANTVLEDTEFYTSIDVDQNLIYTPTPAAVVTVGSPLFDQAVNWTGDDEIIRAVFQYPTDSAQPILQGAAYGNIGVKVAPAHRSPISFAIPLRSNVATYGPWYSAGQPGKVHVEQDPTLTPWNYGGYALMETVAMARVQQASTNALVIETGVREEAGLPTASLGDVLMEGGPNITGIQVQYGDRGFTTAYSFSTFTPFNRGGIYSRQNQERVRRLALTQTQLKRAIRTSVRGKIGQTAQVQDGGRARKEFFKELPKAVKKQSPHDVLVAHTYADNISGKVRTGVSSLTFEEAVGGVNADDASAYQRTAAMSWNGLIRPFSTSSSAEDVTHYGATEFIDGIDRSQLDPWKTSDHDIEIWANGSTYAGMHATRWGGDNSNARPLALKGPLVIAGWGFDTEGKPVPGDGSGNFQADYLHQPQTWKVGPSDLLWDERRGVWTCHDVMKGVVTDEIQPNNSGDVVIYKDASSTPWTLPCHNWGQTKISAGARVHTLFNALDRKWYAIEAGSGVPTFHSPEFVITSGEVSANWGSGILPVDFESAPGSGEYFARYDHVHAHPVFASGDLHPEYALPSGSPGEYLTPKISGGLEWLPLPSSTVWSFHSPEFIVNSGSSPYVVSANWATSGIADVAFTSANGVGEYFARHDHVHAHPVFNSGDLHPEYKLPSGTDGYCLKYSGSGTYYWGVCGSGSSSSSGGSTAIIELGDAVPDTCLYDATIMTFSHVNGSDCCWQSGVQVYLHLTDAYAGTYLPGASTGSSYGGRSIYFATGSGPSSVIICSGTPPEEPPGSGGIITPCCPSGTPETLYMTWVGDPGCECVDGTTELTYNALTEKWEGTATMCGTDYDAEFWCEGSQWRMITGGGSIYYFDNADTCSPFYWSQTSVYLSSVCEGNGSVAITE